MPVEQEDVEFVDGLKQGQVICADFRRMRNYRFHQKWFCLAQLAYEHWEPGQLRDARWKGVKPEKSFERFRKDLIILAGHFEAYYRMDGSVRVEAKSISFGSMDQEEFEKLYSATVDVVLKHVLKNYTREDLDAVINQLIGFM
jgi:hypothetical protein